MFILFAIFNSFAHSLTSGADSALIYDTLKNERKEKYYKKVFGNYSALWPFGAIAGHYPTYGITGICFLPKIYGAVFFKPEGEKNKQGVEKIGTHLVNPSAHTLTFLRDVKDYDGLVNDLNRVIGDFEEFQYK